MNSSQSTPWFSKLLTTMALHPAAAQATPGKARLTSAGGLGAGLVAGGCSVLPGSAATALAIIVTLGTSHPSRADSGNACVPQPGTACSIVVTGTPGLDGKVPGFDQAGNNGTPGGKADALAHEFQAPGNFQETGNAPAIAISSSGGRGGNGSNANDGTTEQNGGNGMVGGDGGIVQVQVDPGVTAAAQGQLPTVEITSTGATGGGGSLSGSEGTNGSSGPGGNGGQVAVTSNGSISASGSGAALAVGSLGGTGGAGGDYKLPYNKDGVDGGNGGPGGTVIVTVGGAATSVGNSVFVQSAGGNGGTGGRPDTASFPIGAQGGTGGDGAAGGTVAVTIARGGALATFGQESPGVWAQSLGGGGGAGGQGGGDANGGNAGSGAAGGAVTITNNGAIATTGADAPGLLGQSLGGVGANGGRGGGWGTSGGYGGTGGSGVGVTILGSGGTIRTGGINAMGALAQSIGGGGGNGGNSNGWLSIGGDAGSAANGGNVTVNISNQIATAGERSAGILAQSIGGGGGNGGNASGSGLGLNIIIGGTAGGGGTSGQVLATSGGAIVTSGLHASGLVLQSIGGGGGNGGAAYSKTLSGAAGASVSVGGSGGAGGAGGMVGQVADQNGFGTLPTNSGRIITAGANAFGIFGQSIGGGGGVGGASAATAKTYAVSSDPPLPTISVAVSLGGSGGSGGSGGGVTLANAGLIATSGQGSAGTVAQSIGGGGGSGGDASATATAKGGDSPVSIASSVSVGGRGAGAGDGGPAAVTNTGLILTTGESADGILAQSVGGGGGNGGAGDGRATSTGDNTSIALTLNIGGSSGGGGASSGVTVTNGGSILTLGDGAAGIMAQGIGGGGGRGGGAAGTSNSSYSATVNVGGSGGNGGNTGASNTATTVVNSGSIVTFGADAPGIVAQSVAGGGGTGGKAASSIGSGKSTGDGGNGSAGTVSAMVTSVSNAFAAGGAGALAQYGSIAGLTGLANGLLGNPSQLGAPRLGGDPASDAAGLEGLGASAGNSGDGTNSTSVTIGVGVGGRGGGGGAAGAVNVTNSGGIGTVGAMSDGILAQSIGGGGGKGGATTFSTTGNDVQGAISVGGSGGSGGNGGPVTVANTGSIVTIGGLSAGVVAQSIGGGGGVGGTSGAKVKSGNGGSSVLSVPIAIGGNGGGGGTAGQVTVTNDGSILTRSHDAIGILAQSVGGGGGIVKTLSTDTADNNGGGATAKGGDYGLNLTFGGAAGTSGNANAVSVNSGGSIATSGSNAYGILAQSIGGGGGLVLGGKPNGSNFFGSGRASGSGSTVQVTVDGSIATTGQGAVGILAQSIGGGGGLAGDIGQTSQRVGFTPSPNRSGDGGPVTIGIGQNGTVTTNALNTPAILAQSIGGGGGRVTNNSGAFSGTAGGAGTGGAVTISVAGQVSALGAASPGIYAESVSAGAAPAGSVVKVTVAQGGLVSGGKDFNARDGYGAGIYVVSGGQGASNSNTITNNGTITSVNGSSGTAIYSTGGYTTVVNNSGGTITGAVNLLNGGGGGTVVNNPGGTLQPGGAVNLGAAGRLVNSGLIVLGSPDQAGGTTVTGDFEQTATGVLRVNLQAGANTAGNLQVNGAARLAGSVDVVVSDPANLKPGVKQANVLTATGGVTTAGARLAIASTPIVQYSLAARDANNVDLSYAVDYGAAQALRTQGLASSNRGEVGRVLNAVLAGDPGGLAPLVGRLAALPTAPAVAATLDALSGEAAADVQQTVFAAQQAYTNTVLRHAVGEERGNGPSAPYATASLSPVAGPSVNDQGMRVWVGGFGANDVLNGTDGQGSLHTQVAGAVMGLDKWFGNDRMAGVSVGGGTSDFSVADRASLGHTTSVNLGFHGLARFGQAYVSGVVAYGNFATDLKRNGLGGATGLAAAGRGSVASNVLGGRVEAGWSQPLGRSRLVATPFAALGVDQQWQGAFSEAVIAAPGGSGLGLRFHGTDRASAPLTLGTRLGSTFQLGGGHVLGVSVEVGWQHEFNPQRSVSASFQAAPDVPFRVLGVSASRDAALIGLDPKLSLTRNVALLGSFTGRFSGIETAVGGFGGLQVTW